MHINKSQTVGWVTLLLAGASWCGSADAGTILVCSTCNHTTIQSAVDDAIDNGIYGESGSNVSVMSTTVTQNTSAPFNTSQGQLDGDGGGNICSPERVPLTLTGR